MSKVEEHYKELLAQNYVWMSGVPFEQKVEEQKALLGSLPGLKRGGLAFDLGCGPGFQTLALAELGYSPVFAFDTSPELLTELDARTGSLPVTTQQMDITRIADADLPAPASVAVCMGDTLTHLPSKAAVQKLFADVYARLAPEGTLVLTYRDLTAELAGSDRFLPVRADDTRIMTCFLEYASRDYVTVHDLIYVREDDCWKLNKSCYEKLRLSSDWVSSALRKAGFTVTKVGQAGRLLLAIGRK
jgi:SAM-dependent methyltransferase